MGRKAIVARKTTETDIKIDLNLDGTGNHNIHTGIPFFDHMLNLFTLHGLLDLTVEAKGDIEVDFHHTVEDVGLALGDAMVQALADKKGIKRYGHAVTPMDETLAMVTVDLSNRPFLAYNVLDKVYARGQFDLYTAKEFFRAFSNRAAMNLHVNVLYGENEHHIIEAIYKSLGRAIRDAVTLDNRIQSVLSTKGTL